MQANLEQCKYLHIVCLNNPYPPDYGGVIDIYFKIKSLHEVGVKIILHCFLYGRQPADELLNVCEKVYYYQRWLSPLYLLSMTPFIVKSRQKEELLKNLQNDSYPVLLEGLHCTSFLKPLRASGRFVAVRAHNIEHLYYSQLADVTRNPFHWLFLKSESFKLKRYESILSNASIVLAISDKDQSWFQSQYSNSVLVPAFNSYSGVLSLIGKGQYILMHGNLSVMENESSIFYLWDHVLKKLGLPVVIAGKNPSVLMREKFKSIDKVLLIVNPDDQKMVEVQQNAQIILLHSHQNTGVKLKLISSLTFGRFVICNRHICDQSELAQLCYIAETSEQYHNLIAQLWNQRFEQSDILKRSSVMDLKYCNVQNADYLKQIIFGKPCRNLNS
jgi:hypothetical protein